MAALTMSSPTLGDHGLPTMAKPGSNTLDGGDYRATLSAAALTPPTSEDNDAKHEIESSSDLSELSPDIDMEPLQAQDTHEDCDEEVEPDHYYDGGKIPVFKPTMEQFKSFKQYVEKIDKYGMKAGIVKIIPPPEWRESLPKLDELVKSIRIKNPIMQEFMGTHGTYTQANIEKQRSYNLPEWKSLTEEPQNQPPARRGERRKGQEKVVRGGGSTRARTIPAVKTEESESTATKRKPGRPRRNPPPVKPEESESVKETVEEAPSAPKAKKAKGRQPKGDTKKSVSSRRMNNQTETADYIDEAAFKGFDYSLSDIDEFTAERCKELETAYWKSLTFAQPMYAADMPGSLFTDDVTSWNVAKLENLLDVLGTKVPGVNTAYLYMGMWKATFAWHLEDVDLYSINYIHFGAPKQWYSISQEDARRFEAAMKTIWPNDSKNCDQFLRHKTYLISPQLLKERFNIEVNRLVHHEGEFVITYPYGYHSGYNLGYNCAESVNFAQESWLDFGRIARKCECEADSVWVDVAEIERKLRGEPTPEYYEETDDDDEEEGGAVNDLPTPPASVKGKTTRKRKRDTKEKEKPDEGKKKRIRIRIKSSTREPCVLCPNDAPYEPLLDTDNGKKAHRSCALYTPETWLSAETGVDLVLGVSNIDKARLDLKCNFCRSKRGACFQCASKKCTRAFHATCAAAAGVQIDVGPVPTFGEDGTEYFEEGFDFRCKFHRARRPKNLDPDNLEVNKLINNYSRKLQSQDVVQAQYLGGEVFAGMVVENRPSESSVLIDILPEGDRVEVEWKWLLVLNPDDSQRPKPSLNAIPMPANMNKQSVSIDNRQDGVPAVDQQFHDSHDNKWAEFYNLTLAPGGYQPGRISNKDQRKIDLNQQEQLYYYLGNISTEARSKYTDDPQQPNPVLSADFMERARAFNPPALAPTAKKSSSNSTPGAEGGSKAYNYKPKVSLPAQSSSSSSDSSSKTTFPPDAYYSSTTLPAAFPGQYSNYTQHVRQNSNDVTARRPSITGHYAHIAPRPTVGLLHSHDQLLQPAAELETRRKSRLSFGSTFEDEIPGRDSNVQWTPPSQIFHSHGLDRASLGMTHEQSSDRPTAAHSSAQEVGRQLAEQTGSTPEGAGGMWNGHEYQPFRQTFRGITGDAAGHSPTQPTHSPLSEKDAMEARGIVRP